MSELWLPEGYFSDEDSFWFQGKTEPLFVCDRFTPVTVSEEEGKGYGIWLQWSLYNGHEQRRFVMFRQLHIGRGNKLAAQLADAGLRCGIEREAYERLKELIFAASLYV